MVATEKIVIETITSDTLATFYVIDGFSILSTAATTRSTIDSIEQATFTSSVGSLNTFSSATGIVLAGTGTSRTVVVKDHNDVKYNGKFKITYVTDTTVKYPVLGDPTTPDTTANVAAIIGLSNNVTSSTCKKSKSYFS